MMKRAKNRAQRGGEFVATMNTPQQPTRDAERRSFIVTGLVQGVGFRPFMSRLVFPVSATPDQSLEPSRAWLGSVTGARESA